MAESSTPGRGSGFPCRRWKAVLAYGFVVLFGSLLASFPARNAELLGHLAAGRDLAHGHLPGSGAGSWAGPGWLFDLAAYLIFAIGGGTGLLLAKAGLVGGAAALLLRVSRTGPGWLVPTLCIGLAVLAAATRLQLQPVLLSYLFLALTLSSLHPVGGVWDRPGWVPPWRLMLLFVVWANSDGWFVLGLGTVALVTVGRAMDGPSGGRAWGLARSLAAVALLTGACLLNPSHLAAFTLPFGLTGGFGEAASPFRRAYVDAALQSPAGLAYFPLFGLGLLSFGLAARPWRWDRFLPWAALAALSAAQVRVIPFFAIVGGPVLAWNLQAFFGARSAGSRSARVGLGTLVGAFGLAFLASAWTGWLQGPPFGPRRWAVEVPPALRNGAAAACRWQAVGVLGPDARALHLSPDTIAAFAWLCPDHRAVREPAAEAWLRGDPQAPDDWATRLRAAGVTHVVVYDPDRRTSAVLQRLFLEPEQWPLLFVDGGLAIFGWHPPGSVGPGESLGAPGLDLELLALRPRPDELAPATGPARAFDARRWWEAFWRPAAPGPHDRNAAAIYLKKAEALRLLAPVRHQATWMSGWVAAAPGNPPGGLVMVYGADLTYARGDTPGGILYLAIRAARRAVAANPSDAQAYALLGEAYLRLLHNSRERTWSQRLSELGQIRRAQAAAAFRHAIAVDPDLASAHLQLGALYGEMGFLDVALRHQRDYLAALRRAGPALFPHPEEYRAAVAEAGERNDRLAIAVADQEQAFERESAELRVFDRASLARDKGLAGKALEILLGSDISAFGAQGMALELELLVRTGRSKEVRDWTAAEQESALGALYPWLRVQAFAADGEYALARQECEQLAVGTDPEVGPRRLAAVLVGRTVLDGCYSPGQRGGAIWQAFQRAELRTRLRGIVLDIRREADALTLRGLLALEEGDVQAAAADFRRALTTWGSEEEAADARGLDFNGRVAAQEALAWIESGVATRR